MVIRAGESCTEPLNVESVARFRLLETRIVLVPVTLTRWGHVEIEAFEGCVDWNEAGNKGFGENRRDVVAIYASVRSL